MAPHLTPWAPSSMMTWQERIAALQKLLGKGVAAPMQSIPDVAAGGAVGWIGVPLAFDRTQAQHPERSTQTHSPALLTTHGPALLTTRIDTRSCAAQGCSSRRGSTR